MCALWKTCNQIMYHPQSGWFDEGPQRGPVMWRKGLKALHTRCCCVCGLTPSVPCRVTGDHDNLGMGTISCMQVVVHCECVFHLDLCTLERLAFASLTARGGGLPVGVNTWSDGLSLPSTCPDDRSLIELSAPRPGLSTLSTPAGCRGSSMGPSGCVDRSR